MESGYERSNSVIVETASTSGQRTNGDFSSLARGPVWLVSEHCDRPRTCDSIKVKILAAERRRMCWVPISAKRSPRVQSGLSSCRLFKHKRTRIATGAPGRSVNQKKRLLFCQVRRWQPPYRPSRVFVSSTSSQLRLVEFYSGYRPRAFVASYGNSQAVKFIQPEILYCASDPIGQDDGLAEEFS